MKRCRIMLRGGLPCVVFAGLIAITAAPVYGGWHVGNGYSELKSPLKAGAEAAARAKAALGGQEAKLVIVFDAVAARPDAKQKLLEGVASVFDSSIVYGCSAYAPITQECNTGTVGVLAIGGEIKVVPALADLEGGHQACGKRIGKTLKAAGVPESSGRLVVLFGSCHVDKNDALVGGVCSVLGEKFPVAGGAAANGEFVYYQGKVVEKKSNLGLLLCGSFQCSFAAKTAQGEPKQRVIAVAGEAVQQALGDKKDEAAMLFAFDCGGRRGQMGGEVDKELQAMKQAAGKTPVFGFYGSGETGPKDNASAPRGVGYHIIICAILSP